MYSSAGFYDAYDRSLACSSLTDQLIMLYDGAISFVKQAIVAIREKKWELRWRLINQALKVVNGLREVLDPSASATDALDAFYGDVENRLIYIQCHDCVKTCESVAADLKRLRDAWSEAAQSVKEPKQEERMILEPREAEEVNATDPIRGSFPGAFPGGLAIRA